MKRLVKYLRMRRLGRDLANEMQAHVNEKTDELIDAGLPPDEARARALREFGNRAQLAEECREQWGFRLIEEVAQDLRYAFRVLRRTPAFFTVAVLSLALGIGANTVIFSVVDHVLLEALPYPHSDRLIALWSRSAAHGLDPMHVSAADFYDWEAQSRAFESLAAYSNWPMNLTNVDEPRRLDTQLVSATFFSTLGVSASIGRTFLPGEDSEQSPAVVVISHHLWRELGESQEIVGRKLTLNGSPATVAGVMPASFAFPSPRTDAWVPLSLSASNRSNREGRWLSVIARLRADASRREATAEMEVIARRLADAYPATNKGWDVAVTPLQEDLVGKTRPILLTVQGGTFLLLLISCVNIANLLLAKGASRARELGMRAALGAGRGRIFRQMILESAVLSIVGGAIGFGLAFEGIAVVSRFADGLIPRIAEAHVSGGVAVFALAVTLLTCSIFGLAPALAAARSDLRAHLISGGRGTAHHVESKRGMLVAIEVGLATVLLIGAALLGESLFRLLSTSPGLKTDHLLTVRMTLSRSQYPTSAQQGALLDQVLERVRSLPGVLAAASISDTPLEGNNPTLEFAAMDALTPTVRAGLRVISAGYLATAAIPVLQGRDFTIDDRAESMAVAIINETMARRRWPGGNSLGRSLRLKEDRRLLTVIGVVPDIKQLGLAADEGPAVYIPYGQKTQDWLAWSTIVVRTAGEPMSVATAVRAAIRAVDKNQAVGEINTLEDVLARSTAAPRFTTSTVITVSGLALLIAALGVYGLVAYALSRRIPELGIRLTLGATPMQVSWLLLRDTMVRVLAGICAGLLAAWWLARWLESLLFGVLPHDPATFACVALVLVLVSLAAVLMPALRAIKIDPASALRLE